VVAVNTVQFWPDPESDLRRVRRVLKPGGTLVLGLGLKNPARRFLGGLGHTEEEVTAIEAMLAGAGFTGISTRRYQQGQERAAYLVAARPLAG
jgi:SAM-dependent methyltransferase